MPFLSFILSFCYYIRQSCILLLQVVTVAKFKALTEGYSRLWYRFVIPACPPSKILLWGNTRCLSYDICNELNGLFTTLGGKGTF